jgi:tetratricopeptide (TPR) repeat protein
MKSFSILLLAFLCNALSLVAQNVANESIYTSAIELFEKQKYAAAKLLFKQHIAQNIENTDHIQAHSYLALCALYLKNLDFEYYVSLLSEKYTNHPISLETYKKIGAYFFSQNEYAQAIKYFKKLHLTKPNSQNLTQIYQLAFSYFSIKDYKEANKFFNFIKGGEHEYAYLSSYYAGYLEYLRADYTPALADILKSVYDEKIKQDAELLLVSIYYKQKRYQNVIDYVLKNKKEGLPAFDLLMGDSYLMQGDSVLALSYFEKYIKYSKVQPNGVPSNGVPSNRHLFYKIATAYSSSYVNNLPFAALYFGKVADAEDSLAQVGAYQLGFISIRLQDKNAAINAFEKCRRLNFNKELQKSAAFHYLKLNFETDNAQNAILGCLFYERNFPNDENIPLVNSMRSNAYSNTSNHAVAMQYIEQMKDKDDKAQLAYQRITFNRAVELFDSREYLQARNMLRKSLRYPHQTKLLNGTYFLLGEIFWVIQKPDSALFYYQKVETTSEYAQATILGMAHTYFVKDDYINAIHYFQQYLATPTATQQEEAYSKLGDCYFKQAQYDKALKNYELARNSGSHDILYSYYQRALCMMELHRTAEAEDLFNLFEEREPKHPLMDWVNFQRATIYIQQSRKDLAINVLNRVIDKSFAEEQAETKILPYTLLKRGDIYAEKFENTKATSDYKTIIEKFPATEPSEQAQQRLQDFQMRGIAVPNLSYLINRNMRPRAGNPFAKAPTLDDAKTYYNEGDYKNAMSVINSFLQSMPPSEMTKEADFLLGQCHESLGEMEKASAYYQRSALRKGFLKSAEIDLQMGLYQNAIDKYEKILQEYAEEAERTEAKMSIAKAYFALKNYTKTVYYLDQLKNNTPSQPAADLYFGKIYLAQEQYEEALLVFKKVIEATTDAYAAEAQHLIGVAYRQQENYIVSNDELQKVKEKYPVHAVWVYESLFLIAENYFSMDNLFQAKSTMQWLIENSQEAKMMKRARERLNEWH